MSLSAPHKVYMSSAYPPALICTSSLDLKIFYLFETWPIGPRLKKQRFDQVFNLWLAENNYPDLPHSQGSMKFAAQISPLLNFIYLEANSADNFCRCEKWAINLVCQSTFVYPKCYLFQINFHSQILVQ